MRYDFSMVDDVHSFVTIPEGVYDCRIGAVRVSHTQFGDEAWGLRLDVLDGELAGRVAAWDNLIWSTAGAPRTKYVLEVLGLDVSGTIEVQPADLEGRAVRATLVLEDWEDPATHRKRARLRVPFHGYAPWEGGGGESGGDGSRNGYGTGADAEVAHGAALADD